MNRPCALIYQALNVEMLMFVLVKWIYMHIIAQKMAKPICSTFTSPDPRFP